MFTGLFGRKSDRPPPPKNQIEVECPACGAYQYEPKMVVSTFCRKCGVHLTVTKRGVTASNATRSGVGMPDPWAKEAAHAPKPPEKPASSPATEAALVMDETAGELRQPVSEDEAAEGGFGVFLKQQLAGAQPATTGHNGSHAPAQDEPAAEAELVPADEAEEGSGADGAAVKRPQSNSPPPTPAPPPMNEGTLQKMRDAGIYRNHYFKDAHCFECGHKFKVNRSLRAVTCANCGVAIPMEDVEINMLTDRPIKTRGDVIIRKRGHVRAEYIQCRELRCFGTFESNVQAEGDVVFRANGRITGRIECRRLIIEKGSDVSLLNEARAAEIEVHAKVAGSLVSTGRLVIGANGSVDGDVTARSVSIEPGGELNGAMNILSGVIKNAD